MELIDALYQRHSVRQYLMKPIEAEVVEELEKEIAACNEESGLNISLKLNEPRVFDCLWARYGKFKNANNCFVLKGKDREDFDAAIGYYGERLVIKSQQLGLNTCWVAGSYNKKIPDVLGVRDGEKLAMVIALGYGETQGKPRKSKTMDQVSNVTESSPEWFRRGVEAALLAPTAINQQKFFITLGEGSVVTFKSGVGPYAKTDIGIVRYNFELAAGKENFRVG